MVSQGAFSDIPPQELDAQDFTDVATKKYRLLRDRYKSISPPDPGEDAHIKIATVSLRYYEDLARHRRARRRATVSVFYSKSFILFTEQSGT